jgi:hypothetical protein
MEYVSNKLELRSSDHGHNDPLSMAVKIVNPPVKLVKEIINSKDTKQAKISRKGTNGQIMKGYFPCCKNSSFPALTKVIDGDAILGQQLLALLIFVEMPLKPGTESEHKMHLAHSNTGFKIRFLLKWKDAWYIS